MISFRSASKEDSLALSQLAFNSEEYLGYDFDYMDKFSKFYNVTEEFIKQNIVYIMKNVEIIIGFWGLKKVKDNWELEFFYIASEYIGKRYGSKLWKHLILKCKENKISEFELVTSPQSELFYKKMGAVLIGHVESSIISGKIIPKLKYKL